jgi:CheY-like chemotaxis protein
MTIARILIIEDNQFNHELIEYLLTQTGYSTLSAWNGQEGLELTRESLPDLILCDLQMPVMNGYEFVTHIKKEAPLNAIPIVAVTASSMMGDSKKVLSAGFDGYIPKPIEPSLFVQQIEVFLPPHLRRASLKE